MNIINLKDFMWHFIRAQGVYTVTDTVVENAVIELHLMHEYYKYSKLSLCIHLRSLFCWFNFDLELIWNHILYQVHTYNIKAYTMKPKNFLPLNAFGIKHLFCSITPVVHMHAWQLSLHK